jgi:hypothetical protein
VSRAPDGYSIYLALLRGCVPPARDGMQKVIETFGALLAAMLP